jgi:hypothetical protein
MKTRYLFITVCLALVFLTSCSKKNEETTTTTATRTPTQTNLKEGDVLTYSFLADADTLVKMRDQVVNFGTMDFPVLLMVHKETLIQKEGWENTFYPLVREKFEAFMVLWVIHFNLPFSTQEEKAYAFRNFIDYIHENELDAGLFIELLNSPRMMKIDPVLKVISLAKESGKTPNDYLCRMMEENIPPEKLMSELKSSEEVLELIIFFAGLPIKVAKLISFVMNSGGTPHPPKNVTSFINAADTVLSHYTGDTSFRTKNYKLSYDVGLWEAKCTYHVEGNYRAFNQNYPGKYITKCNTISTYSHVNGPDFVVEGKVLYSPPINASASFDTLVAEFNGKVTVTYGDCCCCRKTSYLNFKINGETGFKQMSFSKGK